MCSSDLNGIFKKPSDPNIMPSTMNTNSVGTPSRPETRLPAMHTKITTEIINNKNDIEIRSTS